MSAPIPNAPPPGGDFLLYQTEDGRTRLEVRVQEETVWLSLNQMAELFQRDKSVISRHISNVFNDGELVRERVIAHFLQQLPPTARPTSSNSSTSTSSFRLGTGPFAST